MLENVRNLTAHDGGNTFRIIKEHLENLGYHVYAKVLNALDYGIPQKRERIIIVGFLDDVKFVFPDPVPDEKRQKLTDILEQDVDKKYYVRDAIRESRLERLTLYFSRKYGWFNYSPSVFLGTKSWRIS